jgi:hypothetical protein
LREIQLNDRILPGELILLGAYLGGPIILLAAVCQFVFMATHGLAQRGNRVRLVVWIVATGLITYVLTYVVWIGVPQRYLWWPGTKGYGFWPFMILGVAFVPSIIAAFLAVPAMTYFAARMARRRRTRG